MATAFFGVVGGLYQSAVLPTFIDVVGGGQFAVGFASGLQGISSLCSALPVGYLADRWSRSSCLRPGECLKLVKNVLLLVSTLRTLIIVLPPLTFRTYQILPHTNNYFHCLYSYLDLLQ